MAMDRGAEDGQRGEPKRPHLDEIRLGEVVELESIDLPEAELQLLLERGVLPGCRLCLLRRSPFGDPVVRVDGTVLALRRETASRLSVRRSSDEAA